MYEKMAPHYRAVAKERGHFEGVVRLVSHVAERAGLTRDSRLLDAACGTGDAVERLLDAGWKEVRGVDGSPHMLREAAFVVS